ncbi:MAG: phytanoyl-CoA dioxygenase family protein, partial [Burkholderiaceae bacterium]
MNIPNSAPLSTSQIAQFEADGYLILPRMVAPDDCERMLAVTLDHLARAVPPLEYETDVGYEGA